MIYTRASVKLVYTITLFGVDCIIIWCTASHMSKCLIIEILHIANLELILKYECQHFLAPSALDDCKSLFEPYNSTEWVYILDSRLANKLVSDDTPVLPAPTNLDDLTTLINCVFTTTINHRSSRNQD